VCNSIAIKLALICAWDPSHRNRFQTLSKQDTVVWISVSVFKQK